jgi:hypothetical protein
MVVQQYNPLPTILTRRRTLPMASNRAFVVCCVQMPRILSGPNLTHWVNACELFDRILGPYQRSVRL